MGGERGYRQLKSMSLIMVFALWIFFSSSKLSKRTKSCFVSISLAMPHIIISPKLRMIWPSKSFFFSLRSRIFWTISLGEGVDMQLAFTTNTHFPRIKINYNNEKVCIEGRLKTYGKAVIGRRPPLTS